MVHQMWSDDASADEMRPQPAFGDVITQRRFAGEMPIDTPMAYPKRAGDVHDVCLGRPIAAEDLLRRL